MDTAVSLKIVLLVTGSRGDIQPAILIAKEFIKKGFHVRLATHASYRELAKEYGIDDFADMSGDPQEIMDSPQIKKLFQEGNNMKALQMMMEAGKPFLRKNFEEIFKACEGMDAILYNASTAFPGICAAEYYKKPCFGCYTIPVYPSKEFAPAVMGMTTTGYHFLNNIINSFTNWMAFKMLGEDVNWLRKEYHLKPFHNIHEVLDMPIPIYHIFSPAVVPKPSDWKDHLEVIGWVFPPTTQIIPPGESEPTDESKNKLTLDTFAPSKELLEFLNQEPDNPPIYFGFGSMSFIDSKKIFKLIVQVTDHLKKRAIFCAGWSKLEPEVEELVKSRTSLILIKSAPHDWLFSKCIAIVHHGGAGTTGASLRAGRPSLICSTLADQPYWGKKLQELKLGHHFPLKDITYEKLLKGLVDILRPEVLENAKRIGEVVSKEDGAKTIVEKVSQRLSSTSIYTPHV